MLKKLQQALVAITRRAEAHETARDLGKLAKTALAHRRNLPQAIEGLDAAAAFHAAETESWIRAEQIEKGDAGPFDACDLLAYIAVAKAAGVSFVPATPILTLSEAEVGVASGTLDLSDPRSQRLLGRIANATEAYLPDAAADRTAMPDPIDESAVQEKLFAAMDELPDGWMVRNIRSGGSNLKALAGSGLAGAETPEVKFGPDITVGPGWVRVGNRRMVDLRDRRTIEAIAQGPNGGTCFVARPWVKASRWRVGEDPHRHGTPFAGKGAWPCEWRAFIVGGAVVGVANYYGWLGEATPLEARIALDVRAKAQAMADIMTARGLYPRYMDLEFARRHPKAATLLNAFPRDGVACTIDFIETSDGLLMLEGGPAHTPFGGGHCCAFAGTNGAPKMGNAMDVSGVAFALLDGVVLADMATWENGRDAQRAGRILSFDDAEQLATSVDS